MNFFFLLISCYIFFLFNHIMYKTLYSPHSVILYFEIEFLFEKVSNLLNKIKVF